MQFYPMLAAYYDEIFPFVPETYAFLRWQAGRGRVLDAGCATGAYLKTFLERGVNAVGLEYEPLLAPKEALVGDMHRLPFGDASFSFAYIIGNTLAHVQSTEGLAMVMAEMHRVLEPGGKLAVQIMNYDRILSLRPEGLPEIETGHVRFRRTYHYREDGRITFEGVITEKTGEAEQKSATVLYPITSGELTDAAGRAGFTSVKLFGDFTCKPYDAQESFMTVALFQA